MKILFITHTIGSFGGTQRIITTLANKFSEKHEVTIHCWSARNPQPVYKLNPEVNLMIRGMTFLEKVFREATGRLSKTGFFNSKYTHWLHEYLLFFPSIKKYYANLINSNKYDIVIAGRVFEMLLISSITHKIDAVTFGRIPSSYERFQNEARIFSPFLKKIDAVVCLSKSDKQKFGKLIGQNVTYIYNANSFKPEKRTTLENKKFLALGRCAHGKGFDILVKAFIIFSKSNQDWTLDIVGDGPLKEELHELIRKNKLEHRIKLLPSTLDVENVYPYASVFIFTSRFEGFGIVQVEALSCGLPIIASNIPITKELLGGKNVGAFFETENSESLAEVMLSFTTRDLTEMSENAFEYAKKFTVENTVRKWEILFQKKLKQKDEIN